MLKECYKLSRWEFMPPGVALRGHRNGHDEILLKDGGEWPQGKESRSLSQDHGGEWPGLVLLMIYVNKVTRSASQAKLCLESSGITNEQRGRSCGLIVWNIIVCPFEPVSYDLGSWLEARCTICEVEREKHPIDAIITFKGCRDFGSY